MDRNWGNKMDKMPRTVEEVYNDYNGRRAGLIKALTVDANEFYYECDSEHYALCLYGLPDGTWEINLPAEEVPPDLPVPASGINFARIMIKKDWLSLIAAHSDSWLHAVAIYFVARNGFTKEKRLTLFQMINELPLVSEVLSGKANQYKNYQAPQNSNINNIFSGMSLHPGKTGKDKVRDDKLVGTICSGCGGDYADGEFWIFCDLCKLWYHGACEKMTPDKAKLVEQYKCRRCRKRP